jgi:uncharacterized membrane protein required for colicin V production
VGWVCSTLFASGFKPLTAEIAEKIAGIAMIFADHIGTSVIFVVGWICSVLFASGFKPLTAEIAENGRGDR